MNTSQKESIGAARRSGSRLICVHARVTKALAAVTLAALLVQAPAFAWQQAGQAAAAKGVAAKAGDDGVPVRISVAGTKDEPYLVAQIGEFPFDLLDDAGKQFLKQEFFEHFFADTFGLDLSEVRSTMKIKLLPQTKELEREGEFAFDGIAGRIHVVVAKRSVLVTCKFSEEVKLDKGSLASFSLPRAARSNG